MTNEMWHTTLDALKATVGANNFSNWIAPLEFAQAEDGVVTFQVPTTFIGNYVNQNFGEQIKYQLAQNGQPVSRLVFRASGASRPAQRAANPVPKPTRLD